VTVSLVAGEGGCCELELTSVDGTTWSEAPPNVPIGDLVNPCPRPTARWEFTDTSAPPAFQNTTVIFTCSGCNGCDEVIAQGCGCTDSIPQVLTASVDGGVSCCGQFSVPLAYNQLEGGWVGESPSAMCGHAIKLKLTCSGSAFQLALIAPGSGPCLGDSDADSSPGCDPINLSFSLNANGVGCCGGGVGGGVLGVTVTE